MGCHKILKKIAFLALAIVLYKVYKCCQTPTLPELESNPWWGPGKPSQVSTDVVPFKIQISKEDIDDLNTRLSLPHRLTPALENANFTYGFTAEVLTVISEYWRTKYDWKSREARMNQFSQFKTQIEGLDIYFIHVKPKDTSGKKVIPLLMIHGWPGSVAEFDEIIPILTTPQQGRDFVFEVICPSIPGFGFSQASSKMGLGLPQISQIFLKLMKRLEIEKFYVQGGDLGSMIVSAMTTYYPDNVLGMHLNMFSFSNNIFNLKYFLGAFLPSGTIMSPEKEELFYPFSNFISLVMRETGYAHIQSTKPDTVGAALTESPVGLAAYILEKFSTGTNLNNVYKPDGGLLSKDFPISLDRLLDNISLYWFTKSMTTSFRYYAESFPKLGLWKLDEIPTSVPSGFSSFRYEVLNRPKSFINDKYKNVVDFQDHEIGGHFAAMELPEVLASDVYQFVSIVENKSKPKTKSSEL